MSAPFPPASLTSRFSLKYLRCPALTVVLALPCSPRKSSQLTSELGILGWLGALSTLNLALLVFRSAHAVRHECLRAGAAEGAGW